MTDETKLQSDINKAQRAKLLLEDPVLVEAFETLEKQLIEAWIGTKPHEAVGRENAFRMIHAQRKIKDALMLVMSNGRMAQAEMAKLMRDAELKQKYAA